MTFSYSNLYFRVNSSFQGIVYPEVPEEEAVCSIETASWRDISQAGAPKGKPDHCLLNAQ